MTEFGDAAVVLPLAGAIFLWLLLSQARRAALWWAASIALCAGSTAILKILFYGCPPISDLHSPSGHTSLSTLAYGALTLVTSIEGGSWRQRTAIAGGAGLVLAIAISRLLLDTHSLPEVALGLLIGAATLALFGLNYRRYQPEHARLLPLLVAAGVLVSVLHGRELRAEELLHRIAGYLRIDCR